MERRQKTFPVRFEITNPTRFSPGELKMFYAHEWEAYQRTLYSDARPQPDAEPHIELPAAQIIAPPLESLLSQDDDATSCSAAPPCEPEPSSPSVMSSASSNPASVVCPIPNPPAASTRFASDNPIRIVIPSESAKVGGSRGSASGFAPPDFARHAGRCAICTHPDRDAIEADFIRWRSPQIIARDYNLSNRSLIYRHAHSSGLFAWRRRELGRVLEGILESAEHIPLDASDVIIRAARIYAHLDEHGNWFEPARINFVLTGSASSFRVPSGIVPLPKSPPRERRARKRNARRKKSSSSRIRSPRQPRRNPYPKQLHDRETS